ncbi:MAG TPA: 3,4-dihydroxy-2-butanone-4-phosphate synthase [Caulobacterales bacterium]|nr:3,4-dihydroxy-2-butanone-4-phosphate synthase [Caulobacterales bacterium]
MADQSFSLDDLKRCLSPAPEVIEDAREGKMFILIDEEDRENEGDLVIPAQFAKPAAVNFMAKHGRGLICLALTAERTAQLGLEPMSPRNQTRNKTAFTVSIEAKEGISTGISAHDRAHTIAVAIDPSKGADDIVTPGHVFPLTAREGGTLVRAGHTEASVDIARLAGLIPAAVICEIMNDDGTMARLPELAAFAQFHNLKIGAISDLIAHRRLYDHFIDKVMETPFETRWGTGFRLVLFRNKIDGVEHAALVKGEIDPNKPALVRVHRVDFASDVLGGAGPRAALIEKALAEIEAEGAGVLVLLRDLSSGRLSRLLRGEGDPTEDVQDSEEHTLRVVGVASQILRELGVGRMVVLSTTPPQRVVGAEGYGLAVEGWRGFKS